MTIKSVKIINLLCSSYFRWHDPNVALNQLTHRQFQ